MLRIERSGDPQVGESYSLSCVTAESDGADYTSLTWSDSDGHVLVSDSSGSLSSLELEFDTLNLSHVDSYTCTLHLSSGDSRQLTENILATGILGNS